MKSTLENHTPNKCERLVTDETDFAPNNYHVKNWEFFLLGFSIFSYVIDVFFDMNLAVNFYKKGEITYANLTILFVLIPSFITIAVSLRWYFMDETEKKHRSSRTCWCFRVIVMMLQLAPVLRYVDSLCHAWKCRRAERRKDTLKQRQYYKLMLKEDADAALLRVFECFLEAAPQLVLQMTIIMIQTANMKLEDVSKLSLSQAPQALSILTSLVSIAWSMASYQRSIRFAQDDKLNLSIAGSMLHFTWHILIAVSRILSFSVLASVYSLYTGCIAIGHWLLMVFWLIVWRRPRGCEGHHFIWTGALCWVLGLVYLFVYISTREGRTRNFYLLYYAVFFLENLGMLGAYTSYFLSDDSLVKPIYFSPVLVGASVSFFAGLIAMLVYYGWFHPVTDGKFDDTRQDMTPASSPNNSTAKVPLQNDQELVEIDLNNQHDIDKI
ncbi:hypothetical protein B566_EDAN008145 [Ephemera danica]|nr:hypothetical protein B566_EDAN008145 [Ephemera danica]